MNKPLTEKEYQDNYDLFKISNNRIKQVMIKNDLIDIDQVIKKLPKGKNLTQSKFI